MEKPDADISLLLKSNTRLSPNLAATEKNNYFVHLEMPTSPVGSVPPD